MYGKTCHLEKRATQYVTVECIHGHMLVCPLYEASLESFARRLSLINYNIISRTVAYLNKLIVTIHIVMTEIHT